VTVVVVLVVTVAVTALLRIALYPRGRLLRGSGSLHTVNRLLSSRWADRDRTCARKVTVPVTTVVEVHTSRTHLFGCV
jgi:hypothetical protein